MKTAGLIVGVVLIVVAWCLGAEWWATRVVLKWSIPNVKRPRQEILAVILGIVFICYMVGVVDRYRKS